MTFLHAPLGLRSFLSSVIAFFLVFYSISVLFDEGFEAQVQSVAQHQEVLAQRAGEHQEMRVERAVAGQEMQRKSAAEHQEMGVERAVAGQEMHLKSAAEHQKMGVERAVADQEMNLRSTVEHQESVSVVDEEECDWTSGRWVYDNVSRPLYSGLNCTFMNEEVACDRYGRKDVMYQHWRWQPHGCDLPRFNATRLLEKLRGKRLVFVGDSLNRNQWVSLVCMVESSIAEDLKTRTYNGSLISFKALEYNATIDFYWSPLLVESNCDNPIIHRVEYRIIRGEKIEKHAEYWKDADVLVFNSYLWWKKPNMKMKVMYGTFEDGDARLEQVEMSDGFEIVLTTLSKWLETYISKNKARLFFAGSSPTHVWAKEWGGEDTKSCLNETEPIYTEEYTGGSTDYGMLRKANSIFDRLRHKGIHVQVLNTTQLSDYRKDAHPTIFRKQYAPLTKEQLANPKSYADCTHWCLPGVPDVWNEILYAYLMYK